MPYEVGSGKALIVDDEPSRLKLLEIMLLGFGLECITTKSTHSAVGIIAREKLELVYTDGLNGLCWMVINAALVLLSHQSWDKTAGE